MKLSEAIFKMSPGGKFLFANGNLNPLFCSAENVFRWGSIYGDPISSYQLLNYWKEEGEIMMTAEEYFNEINSRPNTNISRTSFMLGFEAGTKSRHLEKWLEFETAFYEMDNQEDFDMISLLKELKPE